MSGPFDNSTGSAITKNGAGSLVISGVQTHALGASLAIEEGEIAMNSDAGSRTSRNLTITANSHLTLGSTQHLAGLNLGAAGRAQLTPGGAKTLATGNLSIGGDSAPAGELDISDNALVLDYPAAASNPASSIRQQILAGRGGSGFGAAWTGAGITSSTAAQVVAAEPESVSVAYAVNGDLPLGPYATFRGEGVDDSSVLVRYTRTGDANLDGVVNDDAT
jgi:autotransporter-associated beta strand protein